MELMRNDKIRMDFIMTFWRKRKEKKVLKLERYNHSRMRPL